MRFLGMGRRRSTHPAIMNVLGAETDAVAIERAEQELQRKLHTLHIPLKDILGKNYTPKHRHKMPPSNIKQKIIQNQCVVYAALPCSKLLAVKEQQMPPVLTKKLWQKSATNAKHDNPRPRFQRYRRASSVYSSRRASVYRGPRS